MYCKGVGGRRRDNRARGVTPVEKEDSKGTEQDLGTSEVTLSETSCSPWPSDTRLPKTNRMCYKILQLPVEIFNLKKM